MSDPDTPAPSLGELSLRVGDRVRFRRSAGQHWQEGVVEGRERDGSVALRDEKGASRSIRFEQLEVYRARSRGGRWEQVTEQEHEQLSLFGIEPVKPKKPAARRRRTVWRPRWGS